MRQSRVLRELSLAEVAAATRLSPRAVEALEAGDYGALKDRAYALLVARSCAAAIGLDPEETALRLLEDLQLSAPPNRLRELRAARANAEIRPRPRTRRCTTASDSP